MLARRITGRHIRLGATHVQDMIQRIESGRYEEPLKKLMATDLQTLRKLYVDREMEPHTGDEMWQPADKQYL
jgi:hypothetical protein